MEYLDHPTGMGIYTTLPVEIADYIIQASPIAVGGQLGAGALAMLAAEEP